MGISYDSQDISLCYSVLWNTFYSRGLYFRVNSREHRDVKIKSSPIIYRESKV